MTDISNVFIIGYGDIGRRVAQHYTEQGRGVTAVCRQSPAQDNIQHLGIDLDGEQIPLQAKLAATPANMLFWFAPPPKSGINDTRIRQFCNTLKSGQVQRLVYISTSAVYGDCQGRWIDEDEPLKPGEDRGKRRLDAEQCLQMAAKKHRFELVILRVPGIYGPGRWPLARLQKGLPVLIESASPFTNRIHQDDLATIAVAAMTNAPVKAGEWRAYNCSDGHPSTMTDYFNRIAGAFNIPPPPQLSRADAAQQLTPAMLSFMNESKRLVSERVLNELAIKLRYPELAAALP